jgi:hypothetical protein
VGDLDHANRKLSSCPLGELATVAFDLEMSGTSNLHMARYADIPGFVRHHLIKICNVQSDGSTSTMT